MYLELQASKTLFYTILHIQEITSNYMKIDLKYNIQGPIKQKFDMI